MSKQTKEAKKRRARSRRGRWLRGWGIRVGPLSVHSTNLIAGTVFILLGVSFIALQGTSSLAGLYEDWGFTELSFDADSWVKDATSWLSDAALFALAVSGSILLAAAVLWRRSRPSALANRLPGTPARDVLTERDGAQR